MPGAAHTTLTPNHTAELPTRKINGTELSLGTGELITFNESNNLKELSVYSVLSAAWPLHHSACSAGSNSGHKEHPARRNCPQESFLVLTGKKRCMSSPGPAQQPSCFAEKTAGHSHGGPREKEEQHILDMARERSQAATANLYSAFCLSFLQS